MAAPATAHMLLLKHAALQEWPWQKIGPNLTALEAQRQLDSQRQQRQQQHDGGVGSDLLCLDQELAAAYEEHQLSKQEHMQHFKE